MNNKLALSLIVACAVLSGCASDTNNGKPDSTTAAAEPTVAATAEPTAEVTPAPTTAPTEVPEAEPTAAEKLALDYIITYVNNSDVAAKKKFVAEHLHPGVQALFKEDQLTETEPELKVLKPKVIESTEYKDDNGTKVDAVLLQGEKRSNMNNEVIVLIADHKIFRAMEAVERAEFDNVRSKFKAPVPAVTVPPLTVLDELVNFMIVDVWNEGFADFHYYSQNGKNSVGEKMDIQATMERLAVAMAHKKESDSYIAGLSAEYDDVKKVWAPLSKETDRLYAQLLAGPPKPKDPNTKFDTEAFRQYRDDFQEKIDTMLLENK
ncbi:PT domain-containing protein [Paenibacillus sp. FSL R7-0302]|uniref:PT domain-containing protein n=1 Tax=Paenibacillus sp. FSL R7-0302 TaxID=2921681 RepID=UPI0030F83E68